MAESQGNSGGGYFITNIIPAKLSLLKSDIYLVMLHADRIPPHIMVCISGKLFSLGVKGNLVDVDLEIYFRTIHKFRIPSLFINIAMPPLFSLKQMHETIAKIIRNYPYLVPGSITCLAPVKDFFQSIYSTETGDIRFIFELLPELERQQIIGPTYHLHMDKFIKTESNIFELNTYSMSEVNENIYSIASLEKK